MPQFYDIYGLNMVLLTIYEHPSSHPLCDVYTLRWSPLFAGASVGYAVAAVSTVLRQVNQWLRWTDSAVEFQ